jgi:hypothetical protein
MFNNCSLIRKRLIKSSLFGRLNGSIKAIVGARHRCDGNETNLLSSRQQILERLEKEGQDVLHCSGRSYKYPSLFLKVNEDQEALDLKGTLQTPASEFFRSIGYDRKQYVTDILVVGGGAVGSSVAHALKSISRNSFTVTVLDRDLQV